MTVLPITISIAEHVKTSLRSTPFSLLFKAHTKFALSLLNHGL